MLYNRTSAMRGWNSDNSVARNIPRQKFSFFADFKVSDGAYLGRFFEDIPRGSLMNSVKSFDMPTVSYEVEEVPQYNRVRQVIKKQTRKDISVTLYDDSTSYIRGLLAAYRAHYTFAPLVEPGFTIRGEGAVSFDTPIDIQGDAYPSTGMRSVDRPFFETISLYDLGSEPSSANIYHMIRPTIKDISSGGFDYSDNDGPREITVVFAYEELIERIGVNWSEMSNLVDMPQIWADDFQFGRDLREEVNGTVESLSRDGIFQPDTSAIQEDLMNAMRQNATNVTIEGLLNAPQVGPGELLIAVQKSIQGGVINFDDLQANVFNALSRGTAIQNIRIAVRKALLIRQAIEQGRFLDVVPLLGAGWDQVGDFTWETVGVTVDSVLSTINGAIPGAGSWAESHINGLQLPKIGGPFGA